MDATSSRSYSQLSPMAPSDTLTVRGGFGTRFENGEMFWAFYGKENLPEAMKSRCGTKVITRSSPASLAYLHMKRPTSGKSTHKFFSAHCL